MVRENIKAGAADRYPGEARKLYEYSVQLCTGDGGWPHTGCHQFCENCKPFEYPFAERRAVKEAMVEGLWWMPEDMKRDVRKRYHSRYAMRAALRHFVKTRGTIVPQPPNIDSLLHLRDIAKRQCERRQLEQRLRAEAEAILRIENEHLGETAVQTGEADGNGFSDS